MGADSLASDGDLCVTTSTPKAGRYGKLLMGYSGSFRVGQQFMKVAAKANYPTMEQLLESVKPETSDEWSLLFVENGRIFEVSEDFSVVESKKQGGVAYGAIGSGAGVALGALYVESSELPDEGSLMRCLEASAEHTNSVREPFEIYRLGDE